jgi:ADP-ribose pyrophosphatase YjhB (NUDIX family)
MKVAFVHVKDRKVLVALNRGNDTWFLPGGQREAGETEEQTLIREVKEELAVDIVPDSIEYFDTFEAQAFGAPEGELVRVACYFASFEGELTASSEIAEIDFFSYSMRDRTSAPTQLLLDDLKRRGRIA